MSAEPVAKQPIAPSTIGWREKLRVHPAAELIPPLSSTEMEALKADIAMHGITQPIVVLMKPVAANLLNTMQAIELLDGRYRLDAAEAAGIAIFTEDGKSLAVSHRVVHVDSPFDFVLSANVHRRHLNSEQRRELILAIKVAAPEKSTRQIAAETGFPKSTVGRVLAEPVPDGTPDKVVPIRGRDGKSYAQRPASKPAKPKAPSSTPHRDETIVNLVGLLHRDFARTFTDVLAILGDERQRIAALSETRRIEIAQKLLAALGLKPSDFSHGNLA